MLSNSKNKRKKGKVHYQLSFQVKTQFISIQTYNGSQKSLHNQILFNPRPVLSMDRLSIGREFPVHFLNERESDYRSVLLIG